ncbi:hypothetical protein WICMUC_003365 [Wickerhamomyces mucosus]|uniref:Uncharacterized protein n=1 Tax=Wickerhamomyces mucosus TaxID=1378264 RepID=A0A9P8PNA5_9ASCO|nr:hypothetical protein WICMUC_003365 [Wickerhamomyces mucosus]
MSIKNIKVGPSPSTRSFDQSLVTDSVTELPKDDSSIKSIPNDIERQIIKRKLFLNRLFQKDRVKNSLETVLNGENEKLEEDSNTNKLPKSIGKLPDIETDETKGDESSIIESNHSITRENIGEVIEEIDSESLSLSSMDTETNSIYEQIIQKDKIIFPSLKQSNDILKKYVILSVKKRNKLAYVVDKMKKTKINGNEMSELSVAQNQADELSILENQTEKSSIFGREIEEPSFVEKFDISIHEEQLFKSIKDEEILRELEIILPSRASVDHAWIGKPLRIDCDPGKHFPGASSALYEKYLKGQNIRSIYRTLIHEIHYNDWMNNKRFIRGGNQFYTPPYVFNPTNARFRHFTYNGNERMFPHLTRGKVDYFCREFSLYHDLYKDPSDYRNLQQLDERILWSDIPQLVLDIYEADTARMRNREDSSLVDNGRNQEPLSVTKFHDFEQSFSNSNFGSKINMNPSSLTTSYIGLKSILKPLFEKPKSLISLSKEFETIVSDEILTSSGYLRWKRLTVNRETTESELLKRQKELKVRSETGRIMKELTKYFANTKFYSKTNHRGLSYISSTGYNKFMFRSTHSEVIDLIATCRLRNKPSDTLKYSDGNPYKRFVLATMFLSCNSWEKELILPHLIIPFPFHIDKNYLFEYYHPFLFNIDDLKFETLGDLMKYNLKKSNSKPITELYIESIDHQIQKFKEDYFGSGRRKIVDNKNDDDDDDDDDDEYDDGYDDDPSSHHLALYEDQAEINKEVDKFLYYVVKAYVINFHEFTDLNYVNDYRSSVIYNAIFRYYTQLPTTLDLGLLFLRYIRFTELNQFRFKLNKSQINNLAGMNSIDYLIAIEGFMDNKFDFIESHRINYLKIICVMLQGKYITKYILRRLLFHVDNYQMEDGKTITVYDRLMRFKTTRTLDAVQVKSQIRQFIQRNMRSNIPVDEDDLRANSDELLEDCKVIDSFINYLKRRF